VVHQDRFSETGFAPSAQRYGMPPDSEEERPIRTMVNIHHVDNSAVSGESTLR
jgi:hypothetical protein